MMTRDSFPRNATAPIDSPARADAPQNAPAEDKGKGKVTQVANSAAMDVDDVDEDDEEEGEEEDDAEDEEDEEEMEVSIHPSISRSFDVCDAFFVRVVLDFAYPSLLVSSRFDLYSDRFFSRRRII